MVKEGSYGELHRLIELAFRLAKASIDRQEPSGPRRADRDLHGLFQITLADMNHWAVVGIRYRAAKDFMR